MFKIYCYAPSLTFLLFSSAYFYGGAVLRVCVNCVSHVFLCAQFPMCGPSCLWLSVGSGRAVTQALTTPP